MSICLKELFYKVVSDNYKTTVLSVAKAADKNHYRIFLIGGIVRDLILKNKIKDIDIVIEGDAIEFCQVLKKETNCKITAIQENLRTAKVKFNNGIEIDFASTREEKYIKEGVLPSAYNFGCSLKDDVKRRDFTINTLALNLTGNNKFVLTDFYGGYDDIKNKKIRVLHSKSFIDDPSRIVRALKFQARFDFDIDDETAKLMQNYLENAGNDIPLDRIKNEFIQYFSIKKHGLYDKIIETKAYKLFSDNPVLSVDENIINELLNRNLFNKNDLWFVFFVLLVINTDILNKKLNFTSYEMKIIKEVKILLDDISSYTNDKVLIYKKFNNKFDISLAVYYILTKDKSVKEYLDKLKQIKVLTKGDDLIKLGLTPSSYFNEIFEKILKEKINGKLKIKEEEIEFIKQYIKKGE